MAQEIDSNKLIAIMHVYARASQAINSLYEKFLALNQPKKIRINFFELNTIKFG